MTLRLERQLLDRLLQLAREGNRTLSAEIRRACRDHVDRREQP